MYTVNNQLWNTVLHKHAKYFISFEISLGCKSFYFIFVPKGSTLAGPSVRAV